MSIREKETFVYVNSLDNYDFLTSHHIAKTGKYNKKINSHSICRINTKWTQWKRLKVSH